MEFSAYQGCAVTCRACCVLKIVSVALGQIKLHLLVKEKGWQGLLS